MPTVICIVLGCFLLFGLCFWGVTFRRMTLARKTIEGISQGHHQDVHLYQDGDCYGVSRAVNDLARHVNDRFRELRMNQSRLEATFLSMFDGVMILDGEGNILLVNQALCDLMNIPSDVVGRNPMEVIRNHDVQDLADAVLAGQENTEIREITILQPDHERVFRVHATTIKRDSVSEGVIMVFHDITELRRLEQIRRDFVANVSHELRTPMTNIKGYSETLLDGALEDPKVAREFVRIINTDADRLTQLIDDLLQLARIESGKMTFEKKLQDVKPLIDHVTRDLAVQARQRNVTLVNDVSATAQAVMESSAMEQVFYNLIDNAIKYNRDGGRVTVSSRSEGDSVIISVTDTGVGIPEEDLPRIFERFYRVDKSHSRKVGGTGLGLSIVKHILQLHGGEISVQSQLNHGTSFQVVLPRGR